MLRQLQISNYRSLARNVVMRFGRISVLIGPNGSGKSNALDALGFVRDAVLQGLPAAITHREGIDSIRRHSGGHPYNVGISLEIVIDSQLATYAFQITGDRTEEYRVKSESATVRTNQELHQFWREGEYWSGPDGYAPRRHDEALELTALAGDTRFKPLADFLGRICVYSIFSRRASGATDLRFGVPDEAARRELGLDSARAPEEERRKRRAHFRPSGADRRHRGRPGQQRRRIPGRGIHATRATRPEQEKKVVSGGPAIGWNPARRGPADRIAAKTHDTRRRESRNPN